MKQVYTAISADLLHEGHINILKYASECGQLTVGVLTDKAIASYKKVPYMSLESRVKIVENIKGVHRVVVQNSISYKENLKKYKPDIVVHGDEWKVTRLASIRQEVIDTLAEWGGKLIEPPYTQGVSSSQINSALKEVGVTPNIRRSYLKKLVQLKSLVKVIETHNGLSALIAEKTTVEHEGIKQEFDAMWSSSLTDSTSRGKPDIEAVDLSSRLQTINDIFEVTTKPMIFDGDTGGRLEHFPFMVRSLERLGVSAVIIEDKVGLKRNSLFGTAAQQTQDTISNFCTKITAGLHARITSDFMIIARIESLVLGQGIEDALERAHAYIKAGAEGIMIHSCQKDPDEIKTFCKLFRAQDTGVLLIVVPSSYNTITEPELIDLGVNIVIYANHMLRSAYPAMEKTAKSILRYGRSFEADEYCMPIKQILNLIPEHSV
tara:strand:+ start:4442 stop:5743 length:1302 start_codon:yes stop_codon:yes gene_type:complete